MRLERGHERSRERHPGLAPALCVADDAARAGAAEHDQLVVKVEVAPLERELLARSRGVCSSNMRSSRSSGERAAANSYDAPRELVFRAWTEREHFTRWFGPKGFSIVMREHDARVGGRVRFDMIGPDGTPYTNRMDFLEITRPERLIFDHGSDKDDDAHKFRVTVTFDSQSDGKTVVTLRQLHPTKAQRDAGIGFGGRARLSDAGQAGRTFARDPSGQAAVRSLARRGSARRERTLRGPAGATRAAMG